MPDHLCCAANDFAIRQFEVEHTGDIQHLQIVGRLDRDDLLIRIVGVGVLRVVPPVEVLVYPRSGADGGLRDVIDVKVVNRTRSSSAAC